MAWDLEEMLLRTESRSGVVDAAICLLARAMEELWFHAVAK